MEYWGLFLSEVYIKTFYAYTLLFQVPQSCAIKVNKRLKKYNNRAIGSLSQVSRNSGDFGFCTCNFNTGTLSKLFHEPGPSSYLGLEAEYFSNGMLEIMLEWGCSCLSMLRQVFTHMFTTYFKVNDFYLLQIRDEDLSWTSMLTLKIEIGCWLRFSNWLSAGLNARKDGNTNANQGSEWAISAAPDDFLYVCVTYFLDIIHMSLWHFFTSSTLGMFKFSMWG